MTEADRGAAATLLRAERAAIVAAWRAACSSRLLPPVASADLDAVVSALAEAVESSSARSPGPALERVAESLTERGTGLERTVRQLGCLRDVLHGLLVRRLPAATAIETLHQVSSAIDTLVEACASRMARRLEDAAFVDPLTGLLNRRAMERDLTRELARAARHRRHVSVIVGDLDRLKELNDREGHAAGDRALKALADALQSALRAGDAAYRLGGDEFMVLLPDMAAGDVPAILRRILDAEPPSFSWGVATFPEEAGDPGSLLDVADRRLFERRRTSRPLGAPVPAGAERGLGRKRGQRRVGTPPLLAGTFLAGALLGGFGLASATTGVLPAPAQDLARTVLGKVGVHVPAGTPAGPGGEGRGGGEDDRGAPRLVGDDGEPCPARSGDPRCRRAVSEGRDAQPGGGNRSERSGRAGDADDAVTGGEVRQVTPHVTGSVQPGEGQGRPPAGGSGGAPARTSGPDEGGKPAGSGGKGAGGKGKEGGAGTEGSRSPDDGRRTNPAPKPEPRPEATRPDTSPAPAPAPPTTPPPSTTPTTPTTTVPTTAPPPPPPAPAPGPGPAPTATPAGAAGPEVGTSPAPGTEAQPR